MSTMVRTKVWEQLEVKIHLQIAFGNVGCLFVNAWNLRMVLSGVVALFLDKLFED